MSFDPQTNWSKTEILRSGNSSTVQAADGQVEVVDSFVYLGSRIDSSEVLWRIGIAWTCVNLLEKQIWKSSIRLDTKIWLYKTYIVPVLMYGCESWTTTRYLCARIDASDTRALVKILRIRYNRHITNPQVRAVSGCSPLSNMVMK